MSYARWSNNGWPPERWRPAWPDIHWRWRPSTSDETAHVLMKLDVAVGQNGPLKSFERFPFFGSLSWVFTRTGLLTHCDSPFVSHPSECRSRHVELPRWRCRRQPEWHPHRWQKPTSKRLQSTEAKKSEKWAKQLKTLHCKCSSARKSKCFTQRLHILRLHFDGELWKAHKNCIEKHPPAGSKPQYPRVKIQKPCQKQSP